MTNTGLLPRNIELLCEHVKSTVGSPEGSWPGGYPGHVELALIDAVLSIRARYGNSPDTGVRAGVRAYRDRVADSADDLGRLAADSSLGELLTRQRLPGGLSKVDGIQEAARRLTGAGFVSSSDFMNASAGELSKAKSAYIGVKGLGWVTYEYFLMLLGRPGVKADRHIRAFVSTALNGRNVSSQEAHSLVLAVADRMPDLEPQDLDHAIWRHQRRRR